jgi:hypothetical protein
MLGKTGKALLMVLALSLIFTGVAYAEEATPESRFKVAGTITSVDPSAATFGLQSREGESYVFYVTAETRFHSRDGSINSLADLRPQMAAVVVAIRNDAGRLQALGVGAATPQPKPELTRHQGSVTAVSLPSGTLTLLTRGGESITFQTNERTSFRSRDGSIQGLADIEVGMVALIVAVEVDGGFLLAVGVAAAHKDDVKPETFRVNGEITGVIPGQQTFMLTTAEGREYTFLVSERTRFSSRDGSIQDIHDLKQGMVAIVVVVETNDGSFLALAVGAGNPGGGQTNVRAAGRIVGLGNRSITLQTKDGSSMTFLVDGSTVYRSRDGSIQGFADLQVGMAAAIGAKEIGNGQLKATWVAAGWLRSQNDAAPSERPLAEPELRRESTAGGDRGDLQLPSRIQ